MDRERLASLAELSRLELDAAQIDTLAGQLRRLLGYLDQLAAVDTEGVEPTGSPLLRSLRLRADEPRSPLPQTEVLRNAPRVRAGAFQVPRVVEGG